MLEVGNPSLTIQDQRAHFGLWAAVKAPLIIGTDLRWAPDVHAVRILLAHNRLCKIEHESKAGCQAPGRGGQHAND
jgi:hypothetical protein